MNTEMVSSRRGRLPQFPYVVKVKGMDASVPIRRYRRRKKGYRRSYDQFRGIYHVDGERREFNSSDFAKAREKAESIIKRMDDGQLEWECLTRADAMELIDARQIAARFGKGLIEAIKDWEAWQTRLSLAKESMQFSAACKKFIEAKAAAARAGNLSARYADSVRWRLGVWTKAFPHLAVDQITTAAIRQALADSKLGYRTKLNLARDLVTLLRYCKANSWLAKDFDIASATDLVDGKSRPGRITTYTPGEIQLLLDAAARAKPGRRADDLQVVLALGGFAGFRTAEILRIEWQDIKLHADNPRIVLGADKAKNPSRRIVEMQPNLYHWLREFPASRRHGRIWKRGVAWLHESLRDIAGDAGLAWKPNALRHSFISYRVAVESKETVARESGNSVRMIDTNYRDLKTPEESRAWFGIGPSDNVQQLLAFPK